MVCSKRNIPSRQSSGDPHFLETSKNHQRLIESCPWKSQTSTSRPGPPAPLWSSAHPRSTWRASAWPASKAPREFCGWNGWEFTMAKQRLQHNWNDWGTFDNELMLDPIIRKNKFGDLGMFKHDSTNPNYHLMLVTWGIAFGTLINCQPWWLYDSTHNYGPSISIKHQLASSWWSLHILVGSTHNGPSIINNQLVNCWYNFCACPLEHREKLLHLESHSASVNSIPCLWSVSRFRLSSINQIRSNLVIKFFLSRVWLYLWLYGGFQKRRYPKIDVLQAKIHL